MILFIGYIKKTLLSLPLGTMLLSVFILFNNDLVAQDEDEDYEDVEYEDEEYEDEEYEYEDEDYEDEDYEDEETDKKRKKKKLNKKKSKPGFSIGMSPSFGFISGEAFSKVPFGSTIVLTTPFGLKIGALDIVFSAAVGSFKGSYTPSSDVKVGEYDPNFGNYPTTKYSPSLIGIGYNFILSDVIFAEGHPSYIGKGFGYRGFIGLSFEKFIYSLGFKLKMKDRDLFSNNISMPFNILVGLEGFITSDIGYGNASYWGGLGLRIDYNFKRAS
ncbi:MAG: hypothetical protein ACJZ1Q_00230 [Candidatus Neomarinimicrobiota bacterium]